MRYLIVVRHAESTKARAGERDVDRALSERGVNQCAQLRASASDPAELGAYGPVTALVSSATRTRETFERAFGGLDLVASMETSDLMYNGQRDVGPEDVLIDLAAIDPVTTSLMVVGHNPTLLELMIALSARLPGKLRRGHFPTGAAYVLEIPEDRPVGPGSFELVGKFVPD
ncbi:MAG: SixA phosphatase family protein [Acidimicrobiales bacterium]